MCLSDRNPLSLLVCLPAASTPGGVPPTEQLPRSGRWSSSRPWTTGPAVRTWTPCRIRRRDFLFCARVLCVKETTKQKKRSNKKNRKRSTTAAGGSGGNSGSGGGDSGALTVHTKNRISENQTTHRNEITPNQGA